MKICESPNPFGESPINNIFAFCSSVLSLKERSKSVVKRSSWCITERLREAVLHCLIIQEIKMLKTTNERRRSRPKGESPNASAIPTNVAERSFGARFLKTINTSRYPMHGWGNGDNSAETSQGVERNFELTALVTQLNKLSTKITEVENQCKSQGRYGMHQSNRATLEKGKGHYDK
uniref:Uncharacterized protein n=1 Tax=Solanum tuberosum TaxID=4113 RepID=M1DLS7_SOLTU